MNAALQQERSQDSDGRELHPDDSAFGRFGIRSFRPKIMHGPHWHGHVEFNLIEGTDLIYDFNGETVVVADGHISMFWAGIPHFVTGFGSRDTSEVRLTNMYVPVDQFLMMSSINAMQVAALSGMFLSIPEHAISRDRLKAWHADDRTSDPELREIVKSELNLALRRAQRTDVEKLKLGQYERPQAAHINAKQTATLIEMVRFILENLHEQITTGMVADSVSLHPNYASSLFKKVLGTPMKKFIIRMRLVRSRAMLIDQSMAISGIAMECGFSSLTQFYEHFNAAYGMTPSEMRSRYGSQA